MHSKQLPKIASRSNQYQLPQETETAHLEATQVSIIESNNEDMTKIFQLKSKIKVPKGEVSMTESPRIEVPKKDVSNKTPPLPSSRSLRPDIWRETQLPGLEDRLGVLSLKYDDPFETNSNLSQATFGSPQKIKRGQSEFINF